MAASREDEFHSQYAKCAGMIRKAIKEKKADKGLAAVSVAATLQYEWNQTYRDDFLEEALARLSQMTIHPGLAAMEPEAGTLLFYDFFGMDTRGLALIYLKALAGMKRKVVYVTVESAKGKQPEIDRRLANRGMIREYISDKGRYAGHIEQLQAIILRHRPSAAFLYTRPEDSAGTAVFMQLKDMVTRFQINLTDHAFWLGVNAFDYCLEFRDYGAGISTHYRAIPREKLILMPYYPFIDESAEFEGFPFSREGKKILFSGGSLYKTIGGEGKYYRIVRDALEHNTELVFLYAGTGDDTQLKKLAHEFEGRVFHIPERRDLYQVLRHITLYLNTYPLLGGLMTQYAAMAGKLPLTLKHGNDGDNILLNQPERRIEYENPDDLAADISKLLRDEDYLESREALLAGSVITEQCFYEQLLKVIEENRNDFVFQCTEPDTTELRKDYILRFDIDRIMMNCASRRNISLFGALKSYYFQKKLGGGISGKQKGKYEVSVLVLAFQADIHKMLRTICSCMIQAGTDLQVVVSDDGSDGFEPSVLIDFFEEGNFADYTITCLENNRGTVENTANGLKYCRGEYIKLISPGDYLYGNRVLADWIGFLRSEKAGLSFSNAVYYTGADGAEKAVSVMAHPQITEFWDNRPWKYHYLIFDDIVLGAAVLVERKLLEQYMGMMTGKVIFAEDNVYRLMAFFDVDMVFYHKETIMYEYGTGISTRKEAVWNRRLYDDWEAANRIMTENITQENSFTRNMKKVFWFHRKQNMKGKKVLMLLLIKGKFLNAVRIHRHTRMTPEYLDPDVVRAWT